jgi:hypothetical protein
LEQTECSETSAYKFQTPGNYPKESIQHKHGGSNILERLKKYNPRNACGKEKRPRIPKDVVRDKS